MPYVFLSLQPSAADSHLVLSSRSFPWKQKSTAVLSGITAALVGIIANLALVFGTAVTGPHGVGNGTDWFATLLSVFAFVLFEFWKLDVLGRSCS